MENKQFIVAYRVDAKARDEVKRKAKQAGYANVSDYLRDLVKRDGKSEGAAHAVSVAA